MKLLHNFARSFRFAALENGRSDLFKICAIDVGLQRDIALLQHVFRRCVQHFDFVGSQEVHWFHRPVILHISTIKFEYFIIVRTPVTVFIQKSVEFQSHTLVHLLIGVIEGLIHV